MLADFGRSRVVKNTIYPLKPTGPAVARVQVILFSWASVRFDPAEVACNQRLTLARNRRGKLGMSSHRRNRDQVRHQFCGVGEPAGKNHQGSRYGVAPTEIVCTLQSTLR